MCVEECGCEVGEDIEGEGVYGYGWCECYLVWLFCGSLWFFLYFLLWVVGFCDVGFWYFVWLYFGWDCVLNLFGLGGLEVCGFLDFLIWVVEV